MNGNSSKQVLLSVLGIAILVIAVVGVSFAFFTYTKTGTSSNVLTTGSVVFNFIDGDVINLTNQFPVDDTTGSSLTAAEGENAALTFSVKGYDTSGKGIAYDIYAIPGTAVSGKTLIPDSGIKLLLTGASATTNNYSSAKAVGTDGALASSITGTGKGILLASGKITATSSASQQTDSYTLKMWISSDVVSVNAQETSGDSDKVYTPDEFANMYYSLKIRIDAATATA